MNELYVGAKVRVIRSPYIDQGLAPGTTGTVSEALPGGFYEVELDVLAVDDDTWPFAAEELELLPNLPATNTGD